MLNEAEKEYFNIRKTEQGSYIFQTKSGKIFAEGISYFYSRKSHGDIVITHEDHTKSLFNMNGEVYPYAKRVDFVASRKGGKVHVVRKTKEHPFRRYDKLYNESKQQRKFTSAVISVICVFAGLMTYATKCVREEPHTAQNNIVESQETIKSRSSTPQPESLPPENGLKEQESWTQSPSKQQKDSISPYKVNASSLKLLSIYKSEREKTRE